MLTSYKYGPYADDDSDGVDGQAVHRAVPVPGDARGVAKVLAEAPHVRHELFPELAVEGDDLLPV